MMIRVLLLTSTQVCKGLLKEMHWYDDWLISYKTAMLLVTLFFSNPVSAPSMEVKKIRLLF